METLEQWREQKRRQAMARRFRKNAGLGIALLGLILTFLSVPITGPMQSGNGSSAWAWLSSCLASGLQCHEVNRG